MGYKETDLIDELQIQGVIDGNRLAELKRHGKTIGDFRYMPEATWAEIDLPADVEDEVKAEIDYVGASSSTSSSSSSGSSSSSSSSVSSLAVLPPSPPALPGSTPGNRWICRMCTYSNPDFADKCEMCPVRQIR